MKTYTVKGKRKANKIHRCYSCNRKIIPGENYEFERNYDRYFDEYEWKYFLIVGEKKECKSCIENRSKFEYKRKMHKIRAERRKNNCPDADFKLVWQGGWDYQLGCADGGDVKYECHNCNLHCK